MFDFREDDLRENRRGRITPRQREWLQTWALGVYKRVMSYEQLQ